jgi:hypothetical protein
MRGQSEQFYRMQHNNTPCVRVLMMMTDWKKGGGGGGGGCAEERAAAGFKRALTDAYFAFSADTFVCHQNAMKEHMYIQFGYTTTAAAHTSIHSTKHLRSLPCCTHKCAPLHEGRLPPSTDFQHLTRFPVDVIRDREDF